MQKFFIVSGIIVSFFLQVQLARSQTTPKPHVPERAVTDQAKSDARPEARSSSFIQNSSEQQPSSNFNISNTGSANIFNAAIQYELNGIPVLSNPGTGNFFAGAGAGGSNTTGFQNSFFGFRAGIANTEGSNNTFVGGSSGAANTLGAANAFFGAGAGQSNTSGSNNAFFGEGAGKFNISGNSNSFFGRNAGLFNTGIQNSFFGEGAGINNGSGVNNTFVGHRAGASNTFGSANAFFGRNAGVANMGGSNSFFGELAGVLNTGGSANSFFGQEAGSNNVTGFFNTAIGWEADFGSSDLTYATAIGAGSVATTSNSITLGRSQGEDLVIIPGLLALGELGTGGGIPICRKIFGGTEVTACLASSARYKSNIVPFASGLDLIRKLRPVSFNWKEGGMLDLGLVAEDVFKVEPLLTTANAKGEVEGVKYDRIGVVAVNAIKEQQVEIESLRADNAHLRREAVELRNAMKAQQEELKALKAIACSIRPKAAVCRRGLIKQEGLGTIREPTAHNRISAALEFE